MKPLRDSVSPAGPEFLNQSQAMAVHIAYQKQQFQEEMSAWRALREVNPRGSERLIWLEIRVS
jgi:hypothetical protein